MEQHADPVLTIAAVNKKRSELFAVSNPIMTKPKPTPTIPTSAPNAGSSDPKDQKEDAADRKDSKEGMDIDQNPKNGDAGHTGTGESKPEVEEMDM